MGEFMGKVLDYNIKYFPVMDNCMLLQEGGLDMEGQT